VWRGITDGQSWAVKLAFDLWGGSRAYGDGTERWHAADGDDARSSPEMIRQIAEELMKDDGYTRDCRARAIVADSGPLRPDGEPGEVEDDGAPGGDRRGDHRHHFGTNGFDPGH
jgi:hypothetical protein